MTAHLTRRTFLTAAAAAFIAGCSPEEEQTQTQEQILEGIVADIRSLQYFGEGLTTFRSGNRCVFVTPVDKNGIFEYWTVEARPAKGSSPAYAEVNLLGFHESTLTRDNFISSLREGRVIIDHSAAVYKNSKNTGTENPRPATNDGGLRVSASSLFSLIPNLEGIGEEHYTKIEAAQARANLMHACVYARAKHGVGLHNVEPTACDFIR